MRIRECIRKILCVAAILLLAAGTMLLTAVVSALASAFAAWRLSRTDPGTALRDGA